MGQQDIWNFLFFTGYMKKVSIRRIGKYGYVTMKIPNLEIESIYETQIREWFEKSLENADRGKLYAAVLAKDTNTIEHFLTDLLSRSITTFDSAEAFYHGFLLSLMIDMPFTGRVPTRRRETGGRMSSCIPGDQETRPLLFEIRIRRKFNEMEEGLREAFEQIETQCYEEGIIEDGYAGVVSYGICFCKKGCIVGLYGS